MPNYNQSIIYTITCLDENIKDVYVGSTTNFTRRKSEHKSRCNNPQSKNYNKPAYVFIRANGGWYNWSTQPLEKVSCNDKIELEIIERKYINQLGATLNKQVPGQTAEEY